MLEPTDERIYVNYSGLKVKIYDPKTGEITDAEIFVATLGASGFTHIYA